MAVCYHCQSELNFGAPIARDAECPQCRRDVRVCKNCRHFSPGAHWDCHESPSEPTHDKERRTFCDLFSLNTNLPGLQRPAADRDRQTRARFEALFRDDPGE